MPHNYFPWTFAFESTKATMSDSDSRLMAINLKVCDPTFQTFTGAYDSAR
ncbi:MAG: hypothetical protein P4L84_36325 [Isosphaeraceae bacterium]|nr:hypothetical protein [Isosphaeraceae bacterium]